MSLTKATYSMIEGASVNVLDYGAVGNGVTNDTTAIQAAITAAAAAGKAVFFPAGIYLCGPLNVSASIFSDGRTAQLKRVAATTGAWLNVTANNVTIDSMSIDGDYVAARCIEVDGYQGVVIRNNLVREIGEYFVHFNGANDLTIEENDYANGANGIANLMPVDVTGVMSERVGINNNKIRNIVGTGIHLAGNQLTANPNYGLTSPLCRFSGIVGNILTGIAGNGVICQSWDIVISGNVVEDVGSSGGNQGIVCQGQYITVASNNLRDGTGVGIDMGACFHSSVTGNVVSDFAEIGIEMQSCDSTVCVGNTVRGCGFGISGPASTGIYVGEGFFGGTYTTFSVVVSGNTVVGSPTPGEYGISVDANQENVIVTGNCLVNSGSIAPKSIAATAQVLFYGNLENAGEEESVVIFGDAPEVKARSLSGNADLILRPQGTGNLQIAQTFLSATTPANFVANVGIKVKDASGNVYYIPAKTGTMW